MSEEVKKLYRSKDDRWLGGVCGGIAHYFNVDPTIVRVIFILLALAVGGGFLIYILLWIIIPDEPDAGSESVEIAEPVEEESAEEGTEE